jgi:indolepyruvate ferredoxin oxidoreductase
MAATALKLADAKLDDRYTATEGRVFLTGIQALVRLPMMQRQLDLAAGLNTAGFISGYRGSPLGGFDLTLWRTRQHLKDNHIHFEPGLNEDLAMTAVLGSQQLNLFPHANYDGVFGLWYGKGPGLDRSGDALRHANSHGTSPHGGVLVCVGDDHTASSSTLVHQTDHIFTSMMVPVLFPANVQDMIDFGLMGWAMSRFSGCWTGFKVIAEVAESASTVAVDPARFAITAPQDFEIPEGGLNIDIRDDRFGAEVKLHNHKIYAALAFARANGIDKTIIDSKKPRLGIVASGKAYSDVREALGDLGISDRQAADIGIKLYKVGMPWPLEPEGIREFARGLEEVVVVEEKRAFVENQLKEQLYNWDEKVRPRVVGKFDETGAWLLPSTGGLTPGMVARVIAARLARFHKSESIAERLKFLEAKDSALTKRQTDFQRIPYFCSGCPHNTSTRVPEGSRATAGIGCHTMALWMNRSTATFTHMGAEGTPWIGQAPFTNEKHIFANLGDGTYYHSGLLAIRATAAAGVNLTYKILYNDAVAMTGGQPVEGQPTVPQITHQVWAEGVKRIAVVTDEPDKYPLNAGFAPGVTIHHRDELDTVQRELRDWPGVSVLVYDQTCAAEKRRRRKRKAFPDPPKRIFINERVCEGCGDCGEKSNCVSVTPLETEFGRKRAIDQSNCNKDYSCVRGFCPSFVSVLGGTPRKREAAQVTEAPPPVSDPEIPACKDPYGIVITGIGGTGVITVGQIIGMAAHLEGKGATILDMTGLAQKNGAVLSHIRIADDPEAIHTVRIPAGEADAVIGCDLVTAGGPDALTRMAKPRTRAVINSYQATTADFTRQPDLQFPAAALEAQIRDAAGHNSVDFLDATRIATALMGDAIAANMFMLGHAWQRGMLPISEAALMRAVELNGVAVESNKEAFMWGRRAAVDLETVARIAAPKAERPADRVLSADLDEMVARRVADLTAYQDAKYAGRYAALVARVRAAEEKLAKEATDLSEAVARYAYKLMAYKDEYEVARLFTDGDFAKALAQAFEGDYKLRFHLAPPLLAARDPATGELQKRTYGRWIFTAFKALARLKRLRGSRLDIFGYTAERKAERALIADYAATIAEIVKGLRKENHGLAVEIARTPEVIRGFGHVKERAMEAASVHQTHLLDLFRHPDKAKKAQAAE